MMTGTRNRSGRAKASPIVENTTVSPFGGPSSVDRYTTLLHNLDHDQGLNASERSRKLSGGCYCTTDPCLLSALEDETGEDIPICDGSKLRVLGDVSLRIEVA